MSLPKHLRKRIKKHIEENHKIHDDLYNHYSNPENMKDGPFDSGYSGAQGEIYMKNGGWLTKAAANIKKNGTKGFCTPMTKSTCTPRRKAFAMTMKKHHGFHEDGGIVQYGLGGDIWDGIKNYGVSMADIGSSLINKDIIKDRAYSGKSADSFRKISDVAGSINHDIAPIAASFIPGGLPVSMGIRAAQQGSNSFGINPDVHPMFAFGGGVPVFGTRGVTSMFADGGQTGNVDINVEGSGIQNKSIGTPTKGELLVKNGKILKNYQSRPPHPDEGTNPDGDSSEQAGNIVIPKKRTQEYLNSDLKTRKMIEKSLQSQQDDRMNKHFSALSEAGILPEGLMMKGGEVCYECGGMVHPMMRKGGTLIPYMRPMIRSQKLRSPTMRYEDGSEVGNLENYRTSPNSFLDSYLHGDAYGAQGNTQGDYNSTPGANKYPITDDWSSLYRKNPWETEAPLGSGVVNNYPKGFNSDAWKASFNSPGRSTSSPQSPFDRYQKYSALSRLPLVADDLISSFGKVETIHPQKINPLKPQYLSEDTGREEINRDYNSAYANLKNSGLYSRRSQVGLAGKRMEEDWQRLFAIRDKNSGIYNQYTGQKLGADQYNSQMDAQAQDLYLRGKAKRRLGRREAFKNVAEAGNDMVNDRMYQMYLNKVYGA